MQRNITKITLITLDFMIRPFIKGVDIQEHEKQNLFSNFQNTIKHLYFKKFMKYHNFEQEVNLKIKKDIGFKMICTGTNGLVEMEIITSKLYEKNITNLILENLSIEDIFIDIGANVGYYSLLSSNFVKEVYSFEPVSLTYNIFKRNIDLNKFKNIFPYKYAIGNQDIKQNINLNNESGHNSIAFDRDHSGLHEEIIIKRLDSIINFANENILIKIDTEGYEFEALKGMGTLLKNNNCKIICEFTPKFYKQLTDNHIKYSTEMLEYIKEMDYSLYEILGQGILRKIENISEFIHVVDQDTIQTNLFFKRDD